MVDTCTMINRLHQDILERMRKRLYWCFEPHDIKAVGEEYLQEMVTKIQENIKVTDPNCLEDLIKHLISAMEIKIKDVAKELCLGCRANHPSQLQHGLCVMASEKQRFTATFDQAWDLLYMHQYMDQIKQIVKQRMEPVSETGSTNTPSVLNMLLTSAGILPEPEQPVSQMDEPTTNYWISPALDWTSTNNTANAIAQSDLKPDINKTPTCVLDKLSETTPPTCVLDNMSETTLPKKSNVLEKKTKKPRTSKKKINQCATCSVLYV